MSCMGAAAWRPCTPSPAESILTVCPPSLPRSGVPLQEKQAEVRWGTTQEYMDYRARTNLLVPLPKCWGRKDS